MLATNSYDRSSRRPSQWARAREVMRRRSSKRCLIATFVSILLVVNLYLATSTDYLSRTLRATQEIKEHSVGLLKIKISRNVTTTSPPVEGERPIKTILAYTKVYGNIFNITSFHRTLKEIRLLPNPMSQCVYKCKWSTDVEDYRHSDAVVFHLYNNLNNTDFVISQLPARQNFNQKWVLMIREPPAFFYPDQLKRLNNLFNMTMTYHSKADVNIPYGTYMKLGKNGTSRQANMTINFSRSKSKTLVWLVSNCITGSRREAYVSELKQYIDVDVYGKCGNLKPDSNMLYKRFMKYLAKQYIFYIAFENSDCEEYITEKFWMALNLGFIPIVRGHLAQYKRFAPPNSFVHADSFVTARKLAEHLKQVSTNKILFNKYHEWRKLYTASFVPLTVNRQWMCDLCERVHNSPPKTVDVYNHFSEETRCFNYLDHDGRNRTGEHVEDIDRVLEAN